MRQYKKEGQTGSSLLSTIYMLSDLGQVLGSL